MPMLPGFCLDAVVAIEQVEPAKDTDQRFRAVGSGVLVGRLVDEEAVGDDRFSIYLVTNRHVIEGQSSLHAKFNVGARAPANRFELRVRDPEGNDLWFGSEEFDVAVTHLSTPELRRAEVRIAPVPEEKWLDLDALRELDAGPGDEVFVVGFPLGIAGNERKHSIVRSGIIARLDPEIVHETGAFLVDCSVFPGNSGGPVFRKQMFFVDYDEEPPKLSWYPPDFIGIVKSYLPFIDTAVSLQTNRPRVSFEETLDLRMSYRSTPSARRFKSMRPPSRAQRQRLLSRPSKPILRIATPTRKLARRLERLRSPWSMRQRMAHSQTT